MTTEVLGVLFAGLLLGCCIGALSLMIVIYRAPIVPSSCVDIVHNISVPCPVGMGGFPNVSVNYSVGLKIDAALRRWSNAS